MIKKAMLVISFICAFTHGFTQTKNTDLSKEALLKAAKEIMNSTGTCALITQDKKWNFKS